MEGNGTIPTNENLPKKSRNSRTITVVVIVVFVLITVGVAGMINLVHHSSLHIGVISKARMDSLTGEVLTERSSTPRSTILDSFNVTQVEAVFNLTENFSGSRVIQVSSYQFNSTLDAASDYNSTYALWVKDKSTWNLTALNGTFRGFNYFIEYYSNSTTLGTRTYNLLVVGFADQFQCTIFDLNIPLTNSNKMIQGEIEAMI